MQLHNIFQLQLHKNLKNQNQLQLQHFCCNQFQLHNWTQPCVCVCVWCVCGVCGVCGVYGVCDTVCDTVCDGVCSFVHVGPM